MPRILLSALIVSMISSAALAQGLMNTFKEVGLSNEDFERLRSAAESLYTGENPTVGSKAIWKNEETRSHGEVELTDFDGRCATMEHLFRVGSRNEVHRVPARRCKSEDGNWMIAPLE